MISNWETIGVNGSHHFVHLPVPDVVQRGKEKERKIKFYLGHFETWFGTNKTYGVRGLSLWLSGVDEHDKPWNNEFVFRIKARRVVNGEEVGDLVNRETIITGGRNVMLEEQFLVLGWLKKGASGETKEMKVWVEHEALQLKVDLAVEVLWRGVERVDYNTSLEKFGGAPDLVKDLKKIYAKGEDNALTDVLLKSGDGVTLNAHKVILAARSPFFKRLFQWNPTRYSNTSPVRLDDVNGKAMVAVVYWMYTGELQKDVGSSMELVIEVVKKFEMVTLFKILEDKGVKREADGNGVSLKCRVKEEKQIVRKIKRKIELTLNVLVFLMKTNVFEYF